MAFLQRHLPFIHLPNQLKKIFGWIECPYENDDDEEPLLFVDQSRALQEKTEDNILSQFISSTSCVNFPRSFPKYDYIFGEDFQEHCDHSILSPTSLIFFIDEHPGSYTIPFEVSPDKFLHINSGLYSSQQEQLMKVLKEKSSAFTREYTDMKGVHTNTRIHHIYTQAEITPVR